MCGAETAIARRPVRQAMRVPAVKTSLICARVTGDVAVRPQPGGRQGLKRGPQPPAAFVMLLLLLLLREVSPDLRVELARIRLHLLLLLLRVNSCAAREQRGSVPAGHPGPVRSVAVLCCGHRLLLLPVLLLRRDVPGAAPWRGRVRRGTSARLRR